MRMPDNVRATVTDDGVVFLDISKGKILSANNVGARIWAKLQEGVPADLIAEQISAEFKAPKDTVEKDLLEFIGSLREKGHIAEHLNGRARLLLEPLGTA